MNKLTLKLCRLASDDEATYQDIWVDEHPLQNILKQEFPELFAQGRYKETFMPIIAANTAHVTARSYAPKASTVPVYGCQDGCCIYVYVDVQWNDDRIRWLDIAIDRYFLGADRTQAHALKFLQRRRVFEFTPTQYHAVFTTNAAL